MTTASFRLPSTTALRVLLAIAESGSTTQAAKSLGLSQSAVSKQLLGLENLIGGPAFLRTAQGMMPTEAGQIYIRQAQIAVEAMECAAQEAASLQPDPKLLRLLMPQILGDRWLLPRIVGFTEQNPDIEIQYTSSVATAPPEIPDGIFRYDRAPAADEDGFYLFARDVLLVGAPSYWEGIGSPTEARDLAEAVMLEHPHTDLQWQYFAAAHDCEDVQPRNTISFDHNSLVLRAALVGQGLALVPRGLIVAELEAGQLVNPGSLGFRSDFGYWFLMPRGRPAGPALQVFTTWLRREAGTMSPERC